MADSKISALSAITTVADTDEYVVARAGATNKITGANLKASVAYVRICGTTLGSPAATLDTNTQLGGNIPGTYSVLVMYVTGATSNSGAVLAGLTLNADTGANYDHQHVTGSGSTVTSAESFAQTSIPAVTIPGSGATSKAGLSVITIPFYAGTTFHKEVTTQQGYSEGTSTDLLNSRLRFGLWRNTAAVTRVTLTPGTGNWVTGSAYALFGIL